MQQAIVAAIREIAHGHQHDRQLIHRVGNVLTMEVGVMYRVAFFHDDQGVVVRRIDFSLDGLLYKKCRVDYRPHNLWRGTDRIGVFDLFIETGWFVGGELPQPLLHLRVLDDHLAITQGFVNALSDLSLPHMWLLPVCRRVKWHDLALVRFEAHAGRQCVRFNQAFAVSDKTGGDGSHHRGTVDQCQPFLVTELHRLYAGFLQGLCPGHDLTFKLRTPLARTYQPYTCQRSKVTACAK